MTIALRRESPQQDSAVTKHSHLMVKCRHTEGIGQQIMQIQHVFPLHGISGESELVNKVAVVSSLTVSYTVSPGLLQWFKTVTKYESLVSCSLCPNKRNLTLRICQFMISYFSKSINGTD